MTDADGQYHAPGDVVLSVDGGPSEPGIMINGYQVYSPSGSLIPDAGGEYELPEEYFALLDWTGRQVRRDEAGTIPADLKPILDRLQIVSECWVEMVKNFGRWFRRAAGRAAGDR